jgi:microcystin-dependent protein
MSEPFLAEIRVFPYNFAPRNWAFCDGQIMPISQNTALFSLLGINYGGNGQTTFGLPNLKDSAAIGVGQGPGLSDYVVGQTGGTQNVTLIQTEMPAHTHAANCISYNGDQSTPAGNVWAAPHVGRGQDVAYAPTGNSTMAPLALQVAGGSLPHNNMHPYLALNFCICLHGVFPARN